MMTDPQKIFKLLAMTCLALLTGAATMPSAVSKGGNADTTADNQRTMNLVINPGFEEPGTRADTPSGWQFSNAGASDGKGLRETTHGHSGGNCVFIEKTNDASYSSWGQNIKVRPLTKYRLSFWYKTQLPAARIFAVTYCMDGSQFLKSAYIPIEPSVDWTKMEILFATPANTSIMQFFLRIGEQAGKAWFDDVSLTDAGECREFHAGRSPNVQVLTEVQNEALMRDAIEIVEDKSIMGEGKDIIRDSHDPDALDRNILTVIGTSNRYNGTQWLVGNSLIPGLTYDIVERIKIVKKNDTGKAFRTGVYCNNESYHVVTDYQPDSVNVPDNEWKSYKISGVPLKHGDHIYISSSGNDNVEKILIDNLAILPGDETTRNFYRYFKKNETMRFSLLPKKSGAVCLLTENRKFTIGYIVNKDTRPVPGQSFVGIVIDYLSKSDKIEKRVIIPLAQSGDAIKTGVKLNWDLPMNGLPDDEIVAFPLSSGEFRLLELDLDEFAPVDWNGRSWISFAANDTTHYFSGVILSPKLKDIKFLDFKYSRTRREEVYCDDFSSDFLKNAAKKNRIETGMNKLQRLLHGKQVP